MRGVGLRLSVATKRQTEGHGWLAASLVVLAVVLPGCGEDRTGRAAASTRAAPAPPLETPPVLQAADVLPTDLLRGPDFEVAPEVHNDGFMNRYLLKTTWGKLEVVSTPMLRKRVRETAALRQLEDLSKTDQFAEAAEGNWDRAVTGAKSLVHHPKESVSKVSSGVKKLFGKAKGRASAEQKSEAEDEGWKQTIGYSERKRELAQQLGVDVYSRNPQLQAALDEMAWAVWSGKMTGRLVLAVVPGAAGTALSISKANEKFQRVDPTRPPGAIREDNQRKLSALGIPASSIDRFVGDSTLSPTQQSWMVVSLEDIEGAEGREMLLDFAADAPNGDAASFVVLQAVMYARFHQDEEAIVRFEGVGPRLAARTADGSAVVLQPHDRLYWTEELQALLGAMDPGLADAPRKLLWLGGNASERAREALEAAGWTVREDALAQLRRG